MCTVPSEVIDESFGISTGFVSSMAKLGGYISKRWFDWHNILNAVFPHCSQFCCDCDCVAMMKHRKDCETALYGKESLYSKKGFIQERLYLKTGFIERKASL